MKFKDPEVERFAKFWKMMDALEREQQQRDYQDKKNGKIGCGHGVCTGTRGDSAEHPSTSSQDGVSHDRAGAGAGPKVRSRG